MPYTNPASLILGFHGCDASVGERVLRGDDTDLRASENSYDWLGHGIYFWENNPARALEWARTPRITGARVDSPFVIGAVIDPGHCLNLMESDALRLLANVHDRLDQAVSMADVPENVGLRRNRDCAVVNLACAALGEEGRAIDTVRSVFQEGGALYPSSGFHKQTHIQICVRNPDCIRGYFRIKPSLWPGA